MRCFTVRRGGNFNVDIRRVTIRKYGSGDAAYVRNDRSDAAYQVDSANTVASENRINGF